MSTSMIEGGKPQNVTGQPENTQVATFLPRFDIWEGEEEMLLIGELPGVPAENLEVRFENNQLSVHGRVAGRHDGIDFKYGEYAIGDFQRSFTIGEAIDVDGISAEMHNGVLTLRLPKSENVKPRRIQVKSG